VQSFLTLPFPSKSKIKMAIRDLLLLGLLQVAITTSFSVPFGMPRMGTRLASTVDDEQAQEQAIQCFIVNAFEVEEEGADPEIVCTPDPDDYAWFNGLDRDAMKDATGESDNFLECVEGASPRGVPEWECKKAADEGSFEEASWQ
jgi:hypothetical protein